MPRLDASSMTMLAEEFEEEAFCRLIMKLAQAALEGASEPVPVLLERLREIEGHARAGGLSQQTIRAVVAARRLLEDRPAM
ncbi:hypothetical protein U8607_21285 [Methylobacterium durans]|uniref:hypothetical protein n=1 Tax=Methylobacterium durans TaxID=2202825 RepID=UPI002AFF5ABA|nr:hypothetical protein [Methylobacterium durans]MEA1834630.1 hypothetical protein [Methylobacterium durans]